MAIFSRTRSGRGFRRRLTSFTEAEHGGLIVFSLYVLLCMILAIGMSIDIVRYEYTRAKLQATLDRAVLAAANLEQVLDPTDVVNDYFKKAGLADHLISVSVEQGFNHRTVEAKSQAAIGTMFMDMLGIDTLEVPASGTATESLGDIEIALVLDNSGSMGQNYNLRMNLLKPAAREFIDTVARDPDANEGNTLISIVPFSTQVSAGATLLSKYNYSHEHDYSYCVTFDDDDFTTSALSPTDEIKQTANFDPSSSDWSLNETYKVCDDYASRDITPWSTDAEYLKGRITAMEAKGWTSIEIGAKWGLTMLDPSSRPVLNSLVDDGIVSTDVRDQPFDYSYDNMKKILVVMSDGENTSQWDVKAPYRGGLSPLYFYHGTSTETRETCRRKRGRTTCTTETITVEGDYYSYYRDRSGTNYDYYDVTENTWTTEPRGGDGATQMTWPEVWADMSVKRFAQDIMSPATGTYWSNLYNAIVDDIATSTKNARTSQICQAAKDQGILVFTIGMDTYGQGDATLSDCASLPTYFYDVRAVDISSAFASIALQINQLRLTQ